MRYGNPSIASAFDALRAADCERILVLPLYPQYAGSTTATAFDKVAEHAATLRRVPSLRFAAPFHDDAGYIKALAHFVPSITLDANKTLNAAGYGAREREILGDFGRDYFSGLYVRHTNQFASHLLRLVDEPEAGPKVELVRDRDCILLGVAARDFRGLAACIAGALYRHHVSLSQAHLFSATKYGLALDFLHLAADQPLPRDLASVVREAVQQHLHIGDIDAASLPTLQGTTQLQAGPGNGCCLRHETTHPAPGLLYAITCKVYHQLGGSIHGLSAYTSKGNSYVTVHLTLPTDLPLHEAQFLVQQYF